MRHFYNSFFFSKVDVGGGGAGVALESNSLPLAADLTVSSTNTEDLDNAFLFCDDVSDLALFIFKCQVSWLVIINN